MKTFWLMFYASIPGSAFIGLSGLFGETAKTSAPEFFDLLGLVCTVLVIVVSITILGTHICAS